MSLNEVLEEIKPGYTKRKRSSAMTADNDDNEKSTAIVIDNGDVEADDVLPEHDNVKDVSIKRRRRRKAVNSKCEDGSPSRRSTDKLYTYVVLGDMHIDGYDLLPGEKLVIAKLTPIVIGG